jgi:hypothetical protein
VQWLEVFEGNDAYWLRTEFAGVASKVFAALAIGVPPTVRPTGADGERKRLVRATSLELDRDLVLPAPPCPPRLPGSSGLPLPAGL